jgi:hypothetical protein
MFFDWEHDYWIVDLAWHHMEKTWDVSDKLYRGRDG